MIRNLPSVMVSDKGEKKIKSGHPWVFGDEVTPRGETIPEDGGLCDVYSGKSRYLGTGFFNSHSKIRVRLLSDNTNDTFDDAFFRRRLEHAVDYRMTVMGDDFDACRLIFGEADRFPGWTVTSGRSSLPTSRLLSGGGICAITPGSAASGSARRTSCRPKSRPR